MDDDSTRDVETAKIDQSEQEFIQERIKDIKEKFQNIKDLPYVFIDAYSQASWNLNNSRQQEKFLMETSKLWTFAKVVFFFFKLYKDIKN